MVRKIVIVWMLVWITGVSTFSDTPRVRDVIDRLQAAIEKGDIDRIELFCVPPEVTVRADLDSEMLKTQFYYRITIAKARAALFMKPIWRELQASTKTESEVIDLRWGIVFYDAKGDSIAALYFAGIGEDGRVGTIPVTFTKRSKHWIESHFAALLH